MKKALVFSWQFLLLQFRYRGFLPGYGDLQISISAAELVNQLFFRIYIAKGQVIGEAEHASHIRSLYL